MIGTTIGRYRIQSRIGAGSMGEVYKALDLRLHRPVAIKFMSPALLRDESETRRFLQEARAASALDHANICTIHDTGETDRGQLYLVMAYYDGETVAAKIARGPLPVDQALSIARSVAAGLGRAHQYGIVHRDIKPANLLVTRFGEVKIVDFGLAKLREDATLTEHGRLMGTVPYMSPEQASSAPVDHRTDIWSLGVVLYEMLSGRRPFVADTTAATIASVLFDDPPSIDRIRTGVPAAILEVVDGMLRKAPESRIQTCQDVVRLLSGDASSATLSQVPDRLPSDSLRRSILVMPFTSLAEDVESEHFGYGLADELTTALSHFSSLRVMARTAADRVRACGRPLRDVAREFGVEFIVEGAVRRHGTLLRVSANLIETRTGSLVWAGQFTGNLQDIFTIQEELSFRIADALSISLQLRGERPRATPGLDDITSYDYYLRAKREFVRYEPGGLERALSFVESARARVGDNVLLLAAAGQIYWQLVNSGSTPDRTYLAKAQACAEQLMRLDESGPHGPRLLGMVRLLEGRIHETISLLEQALARDPNDTDALSLLGPCYGYVGRAQDGVVLVNRLLDLDPLTPMYQGIPGYLWLMAGCFDRAIEPFARSFAMDPANPLIALSYGQCLALNELAGEAIDVFDALQQRTPGGFMARLGQLYRCALLGRPDEASAWMNPEVEAIGSWDLYHAWNLAQCFALLGDADRALHWLRRSVERGMLNYPLLSALDPFLEPIRKTDAFAAIMSDVKRHWEAGIRGLAANSAPA